MTGQLGYHVGPEVDPHRVRWRIPQQESATAVIPPHTLHVKQTHVIYDTYKTQDLRYTQERCYRTLTSMNIL